MDDDTQAGDGEVDAGAAPPPAPNPFVVPPAGPPPRTPSKWRGPRNVVIGIAVVVAVFAVISRVDRGKVTVSDLDAHMCIQLPPSGSTFHEAPRRDCNKPHDAEVMGWVDNVQTLFVGADGNTEAADRCAALFTSYTGVAANPALEKIGYFTKRGSDTTSDVLCWFASADGNELTQPLAKP